MFAIELLRIGAAAPQNRGQRLYISQREPSCRSCATSFDLVVAIVLISLRAVISEGCLCESSMYDGLLHLIAVSPQNRGSER